MNAFYAVWLTVAGGVAMLVAWLAWRRRTAPGALALYTLMLALAVWSLTYAVFWISSTPETRFFWLKMTYFGAVVAPVIFFVLVLSFIGRAGWLNQRAYVGLMIVPALTVLFLWTDPWHGLFFGPSHDPNASTIFNGGPWFYVSIFYLYGLMAIGVALLVRAHVRSPAFYRRQTRVILIGGLLPWVVNVFMLTGWNPLLGLDLTPLAFTGTGLLFAYGIFGYRMMDLVPVARDVLVENMDLGILVLDLQNRILDINPKAMEIAIPGIDQPYGKLAEEVFARWVARVQQFAAVTEGKFEVVLSENPLLCLDLRIMPLQDRQGTIVGRLVTWLDISERKKIDNEMRIFRYAMEQNPSAIVITDPEGHIEYINRRFTSMTGYTMDEVRGRTPRILKSGETSSETYEMLWGAIKNGETFESEILNRKKSGELYWAQQLIAPVLDRDGKVTHFIAMQQDITERKHTESELLVVNTRLQMQLAEIENLHAQLREESIRDGLTRLFNRRYMEETLDREISRADRSTTSISAVMMDVDLFKSINDTYGHQAGDTVLQTLGTLLIENTRVGDIACRYGGDEMVVIMPGATLEDAINRAEEWRAAFSLMQFTFGDAFVRLTLSLGVASFPDHARLPNELLYAADKALYRAKTLRNRVEHYDSASMAGSVHRSDEIR